MAVLASAPLTGAQGELLDPAWRDPAAADAAFARLRAELGPDAIVRPVVLDEHRPERAGGWVDVGAEEDGKGAVGPPPIIGGPHPSPTPIVEVVRPTASSIIVVDRGALSGLSPRDAPPDVAGGHRLTPHGSVATASHRGVQAAPVPLRLVDAVSTGIAPAAFELTVAFRHLESPEPIDVECAGEKPRALWWRGRQVRVRRAVGPERLAGDWWKDPYARDYWRCEQEEPLAHLLVFQERRPSGGGGQWYVQGWYD